MLSVNNLSSVFIFYTQQIFNVFIIFFVEKNDIFVYYKLYFLKLQINNFKLIYLQTKLLKVFFILCYLKQYYIYLLINFLNLTLSLNVC